MLASSRIGIRISEWRDAEAIYLRLFFYARLGSRYLLRERPARSFHPHGSLPKYPCDSSSPLLESLLLSVELGHGHSLDRLISELLDRQAMSRATPLSS